MSSYELISALAIVMATVGLVLAVLAAFRTSKQSAADVSMRPSLEIIGALALLGLTQVASLFSQPIAQLATWRAAVYVVVAVVFIGSALRALAQRQRHSG